MCDTVFHLLAYIAGVDYVAFEEIIMTISLSFGEAPVRGKRNGLGPQECFNVTIVGDVLVEYDETFELRLSSTDPDVVLMPNSTVVNIVNDDCKCVCVGGGGGGKTRRKK